MIGKVCMYIKGSWQKVPNGDLFTKNIVFCRFLYKMNRNSNLKKRLFLRLALYVFSDFRK